MKSLLLSLLFVLTPLLALADEDVTHIYKKIDMDEETIAVNRHGRTLEDVKYILVEISNRDLDKGKYEVEVTRVDDHLYQIYGTDLFIKMPYCYNYAYREKAILNVSDRYFKPCGTLIWMDDLKRP